MKKYSSIKILFAFVPQLILWFLIVLLGFFIRISYKTYIFLNTYVLSSLEKGNKTLGNWVQG